MGITKKQLGHLALLSRLELDKDDESGFQKQLSEILDFVATLQNTNIDDVEPLHQATDKPTVWREDEVKDCLDREALLRSAPEHENGFIKTKPIFGNKE